MKNKEEIVELVTRAMKGDDAAFEELYISQARYILYQTSRLINDPHEAEDAAQEVVMGMYKNIAKLKSPELFNAWMQRIISNTCIDSFRRKYAKGTLLDLGDFEDYFQEENKEFLPEIYAEDAELKQLLLDTIEELPAKRKEIVLMYYYRDMSCAEIALATNTTVGNVTSNIGRAKKTIKKSLEKKAGKKFDPMHGVVAAPVLGEVLKEQSLQLFPQEKIAAFVHTCHTAMETETAAAAGAATVTAAKTTGTAVPFGAKAAAIVAAVAVGAAALIIGTSDQEAKLHQVPQSSFSDDEGAPQLSGDEIKEDLDINASGNNSLAQAGPDGVVDADNAASADEGTLTPVSGAVYLKNYSGQLLDGTGALAGLRIVVYDEEGAVLAQTTTNANGKYSFRALLLTEPGSYAMRLIVPERSDRAVSDEDNKGGWIQAELTPGTSKTGVNFYIKLTRTPDGSVTFSGGIDGGAVNPAQATIHSNAVSQQWQIIDSAGNAVYSGSGSIITAEFAALVNAEADGVYTLEFVHTDASGNSEQIKKEFIIKTR